VIAARREERTIAVSLEIPAGCIPLTLALPHRKDELHAVRRINQKGIATQKND
jgi:hypothetical protein